MIDPDADLVRSIGAGDARAAEALVRRHLPRMVGLARRMLGDASEAEDVAQDVFLRVWREAPRWKPGAAKFETWMHRVALNLCYDRLRRRRETADPDAGVNVADTRPMPADQWLARQRTQRVEAALAQLPERQRAAIALVHYQELTNIAAAEMLEISVEALESLLARGRRALKAALADVVDDLIGDADGAPGT
jgi:RNA polymerase sigma-70 factor (ECF subfamily)